MESETPIQVAAEIAPKKRGRRKMTVELPVESHMAEEQHEETGGSEEREQE